MVTVKVYMSRTHSKNELLFACISKVFEWQLAASETPSETVGLTCIVLNV